MDSLDIFYQSSVDQEPQGRQTLVRTQGEVIIDVFGPDHPNNPRVSIAEDGTATFIQPTRLINLPEIRSYQINVREIAAIIQEGKAIPSLYRSDLLPTDEPGIVDAAFVIKRQVKTIEIEVSAPALIMTETAKNPIVTISRVYS